jgi:hypothetical protein
LFKKLFRLRNHEVNQTELVCVGGFLAIVVITGGAAMFCIYEEWTYFNSIYFCVITLTTIGFGDFVALQDKENLSNHLYVVLSLTFILFGLTVVASSMNLLVLKFLTMNTEDERREEEEQAQIANSIADLRNSIHNNESVIVDGKIVLLTSEVKLLEGLKKENGFNCCSTNSFFNECFCCLRNRFFSSMNATKQNENEDNFKYDKKKFSKEEILMMNGLPSSSNNVQNRSLSIVKTFEQTNNQKRRNNVSTKYLNDLDDEKQILDLNCLSVGRIKKKNQRTHYTIRY